MLILLLIALAALLPVGLGLYLLIAGQVSLGRGSLEGPLIRLFGALLLLSPIVCLPIVVRWLAGAAMNLGH